MRITTFYVALLLLAIATPARSQAPTELEIRVDAFQSSANGGEKPVGMTHVIAPTLGKAFVARWSSGECGFLALSVKDDAFEAEATTGWRIEITPLRVEGRAVTFRLRWVRALDRGNESSFAPGAPAQEDVELTLRPGEERTIDRIAIPKGGRTLGGEACQDSAAFLRVSVDSDPWEELDHRLIAADLWLVERTAGGGERSQPLSIRGLPNRPIPFYFDSVTEGTSALDIFGHVVATLEKSGLELVLKTRSRWWEPARDARRGSFAGSWLESVIHVKPQEVVEIALPKLGKNSGPFGDRVFSIRIRTRQVR